MFYAASGMNVSQSCTDAGHLYPRLAPHLLGLIFIFNGKPLKIEEKIMFCCSRAVFPKTPEGTGAWAHVIHAAAQKNFGATANITRYGVWVSPMNKIFSKCHPPHDSLFIFFCFSETKENICRLSGAGVLFRFPTA